LVWVYGISGSAMASGIVNIESTSNAADISYDFVSIVDLITPFNTLYGIATERLSGVRTAGDTFAHTADGLIEFTVDTAPTGTMTVNFREQDTSNTWQIAINAAGDLVLNEIVATVSTQRGSSSGVVANGERIVIQATGTSIAVFDGSATGGNRRINYTSASNFQTETNGRYLADGAGQVSEVISWPYDLSAYDSQLSRLEPE